MGESVVMYCWSLWNWSRFGGEDLGTLSNSHVIEKAAKSTLS